MSRRYVPSNIDGRECLFELKGLFIEARCECKIRPIPIEWLSDHYGWDTTLSSVVNRLKCEKCGKPPHTMHLANNSQSGAAESKTKMKTSLMHLQTKNGRHPAKDSGQV